MKKTLLFLLLPLLLSGQGKRDYVWLLGGSNSFIDDTNFYRFTLDFNKYPVGISRVKKDYRIHQNNASIADRNGNLLMYTTGCNVSDRLFRPMPNGKINEGFVANFYCKTEDYPLFNACLFIPSTIEENQYFLFHKFEEFDPDTALPGATVSKLLYSKIDLNSNNGFGDIVDKNIVAINKYLSGGDLTAAKNINNSDWWIVVPGRGNNSYYSLLFNSISIQETVESKVGLTMGIQDDGGSQSCFSPDGTKYARMVPSDGLYVMDFNRATGVLSNYMNIKTGKETNEYTVGVAFSPNSRFIYITTQVDLFQIDTWASDIPASLTLIDTWDGYVDEQIWAAQFGQMMLAPDCKIYMITRTSNRVMHVIHSPNEKGKACNFEQHGIHLPAWNHASIPNFVNYRLGYEPVCDSTMTMTWNPFPSEEAVVCYPNPVQDKIFVELLNRDKLIQSIEVLDITGQLIIYKSFQGINFKELLDLGNLESGIYLIKVRDKVGIEIIEKVIKK
ncbi:MAG: T9SS type A sorting domain-containing protein [Saprospiraceae bacterium]|nr:T9SS type A sorting domain-containing protein [Candidatus Defluviibacterium haderslevense]